MVEAVVKDEKRLIAVSTFLQGEYGYHDVFLGVPVLLGRGGVERVISIELTAEEKAELDRSVESVREGIRTLETFYKT